MIRDLLKYNEMNSFYMKVGCGYCVNRGKARSNVWYQKTLTYCEVCKGCGWAFARKISA